MPELPEVETIVRQLQRQVPGKKVSIVDWDHFQKTAAYSIKIVEALGFPREDKK